MKSSELSNLDVRFEGGWILACSCVFPEDLVVSEDCEIDTDGLLYVKNDSSYAPIIPGGRSSDIAFFNLEGEMVASATTEGSTVYASQAYSYALETGIGQNPFTNMEM